MPSDKQNSVPSSGSGPEPARQEGQPNETYVHLWPDWPVPVRPKFPDPKIASYPSGTWEETCAAIRKSIGRDLGGGIVNFASKKSPRGDDASPPGQVADGESR